MIVYDSAYLSIKNKYLIPLTKYKLRYNSLNNCNIKKLLTSGNIKSIDKIDTYEYRIYVDEELLFKSLLGDIFLMYIRGLIQRKDTECVSQNRNISANWDIVTSYYHSYFSASLLLRLCHRGTIFLDSDERKLIEKIFAQFIGTSISLDSNIIYEIVNTKDGYILVLKKGDANTHELVWKETAKLMMEIKDLTNKKSDELAMVMSILSVNDKLTPTFPSKFRNKVNYQMQYGIKYINNKLYHRNNRLSWIHEILSFDAKQALEDDNKMCNIYLAYSKYIEIFTDKMIYDYYDVLGTENGIIKNLNKKYSDAFEIKNYPFDFDV